MKKQLLFLTALAFASVSSFGQVIMYEPFDYSTSANAFPTSNTTNQLIGKTLTGVGTWIAASSPNANFNDWIEDPTMSYPGLADQTGNSFLFKGASNKPIIVWPASYTSGKIYYSMLIRIGGWGDTYAPDSSGKQIVALAGDVPAGASPGVKYLAALCVKGNQSTAGATSYYLGLSNSHVSSTSVVGTNVVWTSSTFAFNTAHLVVLSYDIATGKSNLYIDPTVSNVEPATPSLTLTDGSTTSVGGFYMRQDSNNATPITGVDEIRVAKTYWQALGQATAPLSVAQNEISGLNVYPNPVSNGVVYINSTSSDSKSVVVYDVLGKQLLQQVVSNGALNVSGLNKGVYIMKVTEGAATSTKKLVIE